MCQLINDETTEKEKDKRYPESRGEIRSEKIKGSDGKVCKKICSTILVTVNSLVLCVMCIHQKLYAVSLLK